MNEGILFDIEHGSFVDGPGVRTVVFFVRFVAVSVAAVFAAVLVLLVLFVVFHIITPFLN